jgi:hypothetical protein
LACPFFIPIERANDLGFPHAGRLPLGAPWRGLCGAPGHEQTTPGPQELESCNLGYAKSCARLPRDRACDAVRFAVAKESELRVSLQLVLETSHLPAGSSVLEYDRTTNVWIASHPDRRIQRMAECFLESFLEKRGSDIPV